MFEGALLAITEVSSLGRHLTSTGVAIAWSALAVALTVAVGATGIHRRLGRWFRRLPSLAEDLDLERATLVGLLIGAAGVLGIIAWIYPPSNGDSLLYHLPRVEHWIQNRSVAHFSAHYLSQIEFAPLHEFNLLHAHLLGGTDRLDGYVQLVGAVVAVAGAAEMVRLFGGSKRTQLVAAVVAAAVPSLILEATSTQNNDFAAAVALGVWVPLAAWRPGPRWMARTALVGLAGGLAVLTKGSLAVMVAPGALALVGWAWRRERLVQGLAPVARRAAGAAGLLFVVATAASAPFLLRNIEVFDGITGPDSAVNISSDIGPDVAVANIVRATSANFRIGDGTGLDSEVSHLVFDVLRPIFEWTDVEKGGYAHTIGNDFRAFEPDDYSRLQRTEEYGANPWHVLLMVVGGAVLVIGSVSRWTDLRPVATFAIGLAVAFAVFTSMNKWSPFAVRYQVPLLVGWAVPIALLIDRTRVVRWVVIAGLCVSATPALFENTARPLVHPKWPFDTYLGGYYAGGASSISAPPDDYDRVAVTLASSTCRRLGITNWLVVEYPLWVALDHHGWDGRIEHLETGNESADLVPEGFKPCATLHQEGSSELGIRLVLEGLP
jgi:hypothetical protein